MWIFCKGDSLNILIISHIFKNIEI
jgi:hypothetical protein